MFLLADKINFGDSLLVLLIGMLTIFAVLTVIVLTVVAYVKILNAVQGKKKEAVKNEPAPAPKVESAPAPVAQTNDLEIVAAISAAISAIYASESVTGEVPPFRVKSILLRK